MQVVGVGQWLATTWPSHGLPRGSGQMPNEGLKPNFKNKKNGPAKSGSPNCKLRRI
jgi:hypothetical protein